MNIWCKFSLVCLSLVAASMVPGPTVYPDKSLVLPCSDTVANCAKSSYSTQKADQTALLALLNSAGSVASSANALSTQIQTLMSSTQSLVNLIDPDNSQTNGGQIQSNPNGTQTLYGVTPFMGTLAARLVGSANTRYTQLSALMSTLSNGLALIPQILSTASEAANQQLISTSGSILQEITSLSQQMQQYMYTLNSKMVSSTNLLNSQLNAAPQATISALNSTLQLEAADYTTSSTKLQSFYTQIAALPASLTSFIQSLITQLQAYQVAQESFGNALAANDTTAFATQVSSAITTLTAQLQGILATSSSSPYYGSSLTSYIAGKSTTLSSQMTSTNQTQQGQINSILSSIQSMNSQIGTAFTPILNSINSLLTTFSAADNKFITDATQYLKDVNATIAKANSSFVSFATNMNNLWNTTGSILSGQTTAISTDLLTKIGNMTQQAGAEVDNLNSIMLSAGTGALQADAVRQAILANSRNQVFTMIGDNSAALNSSFSTITKFLNQSKSELDLITNIVQTISGSQGNNLNRTATVAINGVKTQLATIQNATNNLTNSMISGRNLAIATNQASVNSLMSSLNTTATSNLGQAKSLIDAMNAQNLAAFASFNSQMNSAQQLLFAAVNQTNSLMSTVGMIASNASTHASNLTKALTNAVTYGQSNLTSIQSQVATNFTSVQTALETGASFFASNESAMIQNLTNLMSNLTAQFSANVTALNTQFDNMNTLLNVNASVAKAKLSDMMTQLTNAKGVVDTTYSSMVTQARNAASTSESLFESNMTAYTSAAQATVQGALDNAVTNVTNVFTNPIATLSREISDLEVEIGHLTNIVVSLKDSPTELIDRAEALTFAFASDLQDLKNSILALSDDSRIDTFESQINLAMFGSDKLTFDGAPGDLGIGRLILDVQGRVNATETEEDKTFSDGLKSLAQLVSTSAVQKLNSTVATYQAKIAAHVQQNRDETYRIANDAYKSMNDSFQNYYNDLVNKNGTIYARIKSVGSSNSGLNDLETNVATVQAQVNDPSQSEAMAAMISQYGSSFASSVQQALDSSTVILTDAQKAAVAQNLVSANLALTGANGISASSSAFSDVINAAINSVVSQSSQSQSSTLALSSSLNAISQGAQEMTQVTASDIGAIIAKYSEESGAAKAAIQAQLEAAGIAEASATDALNIWNSLKNSATQFTTDALGNLSSTATDVFQTADTALQNVTTVTNNDLANLTITIGTIQTSLASDNDADISILDSVMTQLQQVEASAVNAKSDYANQIAGLRGYVTQLASQLAAREQAIVGQAALFKTGIETAAAQDITAVSR